MKLYSDLKKQIIELLGNQYKPSDQVLINELIYNIGLLKQCKQSIATDGILINTVRDPKKEAYYNRNPAIGVYDTCLKNINMLYSKLNISPLERRNWAFEEDVNDEFDSDFS